MAIETIHLFFSASARQAAIALCRSADVRHGLSRMVVFSWGPSHSALGFGFDAFGFEVLSLGFFGFAFLAFDFFGSARQGLRLQWPASCAPSCLHSADCSPVAAAFSPEQ